MIECLYNYRPISKLPFVSKILERIVSKQLTNLNTNSLFDPIKNAYRKFHNTETFLFSILDNLLNKFDNNSNISHSLFY